MEHESSKDEKSPSIGWLIVALLAVVAVWVVNGLLLIGDENRGTVGDMFGAANALFSGCAFGALIYTLFLQRHELKLQRHELEATRDELRAQREQMTSQADTLKLQQFENTFFQLIKVYGEIIRSIDLIRKDGRVTHGRDCFSAFVERLNYQYRKADSAESEPERIKQAYSRFYEENQSNVGHYFRHLYHILKFIDQNPQVDRRRYRAFLRAQLSANELTLLFYNCLSTPGEGAKSLVEDYGMLKHLPENGPFKPEHRDLYKREAFTASNASEADTNSGST